MNEVKNCKNCVNSYMGYGESSCVYCLRCSEYDIGIDEDRAIDCPHFTNEESLILKQQEKLDKAIKALEFYADNSSYDFIDERFCIIEEDEEFKRMVDGFSVNRAGKFARQTLKEIRGDS